MIYGVYGLGGIGKTELAFAYAHDFADVYPGGRFLVPCERKNSLRDAALCLGDLFRDRISDEERKTPDGYFAAIAACLRERLGRLGHVLLVLDNVTDPAVVSAAQTDALTMLGPKLHLLATTRLLPPPGEHWLALGSCPRPTPWICWRNIGRSPTRPSGRRAGGSYGGWAGSHWRWNL